MGVVTEGDARIATERARGRPVLTPRGVAASLLLGTAFVGAAFADALSQMPERPLFVGISVFAFLGLAFATRLSDAGPWSAPAMYLTVFAVFHFGLVFVLALALPLPEDVAFGMSHYWPAAEAVRHAAVSSASGFAGCLAGAVAGGSLRLRARRELDTRELGWEHERSIARVGVVVCVGSILAWFLKVVLSGGAHIVTGSYLAFLEATREENLSVLYFTVGLGLVFVCAVDAKQYRRTAFTAFAAFAVVALPLGLRGEVLFPLCTAAVLRARGRRLVSAPKAAALAVTVLCVTGLIRETRKQGVAAIPGSLAEMSPHAALAELGGTLRPVAEVVSWGLAGEDFLYGASFWAPFDRALYYVLPGWTRVDAQDDERLLNVVIQKRVSTIGFSPVAEGFRNFGDVGVVLVMTLLGFTLGSLQRGIRTARGRIVMGIVLLPLLVFVRNNFTPVPFQLCAGFALFAAALVMARTGASALRRRRVP
jgi:hypothetical protein